MLVARLSAWTTIPAPTVFNVTRSTRTKFPEFRFSPYFVSGIAESVATSTMPISFIASVRADSWSPSLILRRWRMVVIVAGTIVEPFIR